MAIQPIWRQSPNYSGNMGPKTVIVLHWWDDPKKNPSLAGTVNWLCNPASEVSAHYVVSDRTVYRLVDEAHVAWHARDANPFSIGIEVDPNTPGATYATVAQLCREIAARHGMKLPDAIQPHNRYVQTACPGNLDLNRIRREATSSGSIPGVKDMNPRALVDALYKIAQPNGRPSEEVRNNHANYINNMSADALADWIHSFIEPGTGYLSARQAVDALYDALPWPGTPQLRDEKTGAILGGFNYSTLIKEAAPVAELEGQLKAANDEKARLRANIEQEAQKLAEKAREDARDDMFRTAYRTQTGKNPSKADLATWRDSDLPADEWVRLYVKNDQLGHLNQMLDDAYETIRKLNETVENQKGVLEGLAKDVERVEGEYTAAREELDAITGHLEEERKAAEGLRTELEYHRRLAKPVSSLSLGDLLSELWNRIKQQFTMSGGDN